SPITSLLHFYCPLLPPTPSIRAVFERLKESSRSKSLRPVQAKPPEDHGRTDDRRSEDHRHQSVLRGSSRGSVRSHSGDRVRCQAKVGPVTEPKLLGISVLDVEESCSNCLRHGELSSECRLAAPEVPATEFHQHLICSRDLPEKSRRVLRPQCSCLWQQQYGR